MSFLVSLCRYLYVPLGGSRTQVISIWFIFTFIGLWHDLKTRWVAWALLNCVFFSLEIVVLYIFYSIKVGFSMLCDCFSGSGYGKNGIIAR